MKLDTIIAKREHKTVYRDGDVVIKLFDESFSKADILNEALNHARVEETGLDIPKLLEIAKINGNWAICLEYIEGKTLTELINEQPDKIYEYIDFMVDLQMKVHSQKAPLLTRQRDKMIRKISQTHFNATIRYELHSWIEGMPKHNKVCHGDFRPSNIIMTPQGKPYIIDWAHATQGNASADVARTYLLYLLADQKKHGDYYLKSFCNKSDTPRQYVEKWIPIVAASQSVKGKPEEVEFLTGLVDVKDYE